VYALHKRVHPKFTLSAFSVNHCSAPSVYISHKGSTVLSHHPPCQQTFTAFRYNAVVLYSECTSTTWGNLLY